MAPRSLCLTTAFAPVPAFLGGSCPLGCSLSAPATGDSPWLAPSTYVMRQAPKEGKRAGGPLHGGTIAQSFLFCKGVWTLPRRRALYWRASSFSGGSGLACVTIPPAPPSDVFQDRGTPPVPPAGAAPPAPRLGKRRGFASSPWHVRTLPSLPRVQGQGHWEGGLVVAGAVVPPSSPSNVFGIQGTRCTPGGGCAPAPCLGEEMGRVRTLSSLPRVQRQGLRFRRGRGLFRDSLASRKGHPKAAAERHLIQQPFPRRRESTPSPTPAPASR